MTKGTCSTVSLLILSTALATGISAQGFVIDNGAGVSGGFSTRDDNTSIAGSAGYVFNGTFEFGLSVGKTTYESSYMEVVGIGPYLAAYPVRQDAEMPITARLGAYYEFDMLGGEFFDYLEDNGVDASGSGYGVSVILAHELAASPTVGIIPQAGLAYVHTTTKLEGFGESMSQSDESTPFSFAVAVAFGTRTSTRFYLAPSLTVSDGDAIFGIRAGVALGR